MVVWLLRSWPLLGLLFLAAAGKDGEIVEQDLTKTQAMDGISADELLSRAEKASDAIVSVSVTVHSSRDGSSIETRRTERIHVLSDYYVKSVGPVRTKEALFYRGKWYQRNVAGQWTLERELGAAERHVSILIGSGDFGTGVGKSILLPAVLAGGDMKFERVELTRLDDELVEGKLFLRLRSIFADSRGALTQDYWIAADTFLVHRIKFAARLQEGSRLRTVNTTIEYSRLNESQLPGPLPEVST